MITNSTIGRGRLGNQMFQYACLRGISSKTGHQVGIPSNERVTIWNFPLKASITPAKFKSLRRYQERGFLFDSKVFQSADDTDFVGFFQSEKYFSHIEDEIRSTFTTDFSELDLLRQLKVSQTLVAVHVRRGDYVNNSAHSNLYNGYYGNAMNMFDDVTFVVVSDGLDWCRQAFVSPNVLFFKGSSMLVDLMAISLCHHHIIACSSFSWWGAWLNPSASKRVIRPEKWWGPSLNLAEGDICPGGWEPAPLG